MSPSPTSRVMRALAARPAVVAAGLLLVPLLTACGGGDSEPDGRTTTGSESTPASRPQSPSLPPEAELSADRTSPEGAIRVWVDTYDVAASNGDTAALLTLSSGACQTCDGLARSIEQVYADGGWIKSEAGPTQILLFRSAATTTDGERVFDVRLKFRAGRTKATKHDRAEPYREATHAWQFFMKEVKGSWVITEISV